MNSKSVNNKIEKIAKSKYTKIWNFTASKIIWCARPVQNCVVFRHSSSSWQTKNYKYVRQWTVNSKQNSKKIQNNMSFFGIKEAWVRNARTNYHGVWALYELVIKWHTRSSSRKKRTVHFFKASFPANFFLPRAPTISKHHEICTHLAHPSIFFFILLLFFSILLFTDLVFIPD